MAKHALAVLETALREKRLDRTLTTAVLHPSRGSGWEAATGIPTLDAMLNGGLPRGQLSEIAGGHSSGRTSLLLQIVAAATRRGEIAAIVDAFDRLDVAAAAAAGVDVERLLWIRGDSLATPRGAPSPPPYHSRAIREPWTGRLEPLLDRAVDRAVKALNLVLQAGGFGVVALDLAEASSPALSRLPFTTWLRVQRTIEGSDTACVVVAPRPLARSAGGVTLALDARPAWDGTADCSRRLAGFTTTIRLIAPHRRLDGNVTVDARIPRE
jgi:hypothetical protein